MSEKQKNRKTEFITPSVYSLLITLINTIYWFYNPRIIFYVIIGNIFLVISIFILYYIFPKFIKYFGAFFIAFCSVFLFMFLYSETKFTLAIAIPLLLQTNLVEAISLISSRECIVFFIIIFLLLVMLIYIPSKKPHVNFTLIKKKYVVIFTILYFFSMSIFFFFSSSRLFVTELFLPHAMYKTNFPSMLFSFIKNKIQNQSSHHMENLNYHNQPIQIYYLIGETARGDHFSINGYTQNNTTPYLSKRKDIVNFGLAKSCANWTYLSWKYLTTPNLCNYPGFSIMEKPIPYYFQQQGFKTSILSQGDSTIMRPVEKEIEPQKVFLATKFGENMYQAFSALVPNIQEQRIFSILNTGGSHAPYKNYYQTKIDPIPYKKNICPVKDYNYSDLYECPIEKVIDRFDNTIIYLDWQIEHILRKLDKVNVPVLLVYTSDHGENLNERELGFGHGNMDSIESYITPLFFYVNKAFKEQYSEQYSILLSNQKKLKNRLTHEVLWHTIMDIAGFSNKNLESPIILKKKSLFSNKAEGIINPDWFLDNSILYKTL